MGSKKLHRKIIEKALQKYPQRLPNSSQNPSQSAPKVVPKPALAAKGAPKSSRSPKILKNVTPQTPKFNKIDAKILTNTLRVFVQHASKNRSISTLPYPTASTRTCFVLVMGYLLSCIPPSIARSCQESLQARGGGESP